MKGGDGTIVGKGGWCVFCGGQNRGSCFVFITGLSCYHDPSIIIILPLNILHPCAPSFALRILRFCVPAHFCRKQVAWLESHLELVADGFELVTFVFFVPHAFLRINRIGLPALDFFAIGAHVFFKGASLLSFFFFFSVLPRDLDHLSFLRLRPCDLRSSSDNSLLEVAPYADLMYSELESSLSIIE